MSSQIAHTPLTGPTTYDFGDATPEDWPQGEYMPKDVYAALAADNEWLREGLRGIARMDPRTEGDRMVLWANDTLSGRATDLAATETKGEEVCVRCGAYKRGDIHICGHEANAFPADRGGNQ